MSAKRSQRPAKPGEPLEHALRALAAALEASGRPSMIIGGIAVIARGVARLTRDIDATVEAEGTNIEALLRVFARYEIAPRIEDAARFARQSHVLLLHHAPSGIDIDLSMAWLPFELDAIAASEAVSIHGLRVRMARAEDLVIYKIAAWRPQDQQDVERLIALHGKHMDLERVRAFGRELAMTLDDPQRVDELEKILTQRAATASTGTPRRPANRTGRRPRTK